MALDQDIKDFMQGKNIPKETGHVSTPKDPRRILWFFSATIA